MPSEINRIVKDIQQLCPEGSTIGFVSGEFNVVHPGHLRLLKFAAECCDFLVVGINADHFGNAIVEGNLRLHGVEIISLVNYAFLLKDQPENFVSELKPDIVIKGSEFAETHNAEKIIVDKYGGQLIFSSGDVRFSSTDILNSELSKVNYTNIVKSWGLPERHNFTFDDLEHLINKFSSLNVVVIGDLIVDEYITCEPLGMSQEDPTIVVTPVQNDKYLGGAGIVAAHARQLGAKTTLFSVSGKDSIAKFANEKLSEYGVDAHITVDHSRPTTHKKRFRANSKTLLRVSELRQHDIAKRIWKNSLVKLKKIISDTDLLILSDFNYGFLPQPFLDEVIALCKKNNVYISADSQASTQISDISRFKGVDLITPTEREARLACHGFKSGLANIANQLAQKTECKHILVTLGEEGMLIQTSAGVATELHTDILPAFNNLPADVSGAGDSLLATASMCLALGAKIWPAAYLGNVAAACQVSRIGNIPLSADILLNELRA